MVFLFIDGRGFPSSVLFFAPTRSERSNKGGRKTSCLLGLAHFLLFSIPFKNPLSPSWFLGEVGCLKKLYVCSGLWIIGFLVKVSSSFLLLESMVHFNAPLLFQIVKEIMRASGLVPNRMLDQEQIGDEYLYGPMVQQINGGLMNAETWNAMAVQEDRLLQKLGPIQPSSMDWHLVPNTPIIPIVKRVVRLDVPVDKYPNYNFVGRILGPRGNSLKRVEAATQCRIFIRGRGSVKDTIKEEKLKDKPGYEHLNEPLHILLEAELPEDIVDTRVEQAVAILDKLLKPMEESMDFYKKEQLRELALLNGTLREESPIMSPSLSPSMSPFSGMKRAKTGR